MEKNQVLEIIKARRSVRSFRAKPVEEWKEKALLDAAMAAPSAGNIQARFFYVVKNQGIKDKLTRVALNQGFISEAPLVFVACSDSEMSAMGYGARGASLYAIQDVTASVENILIAATALDLGSCWVGAFNEDSVSEILGIPENLRPIAIVPVGYPDEKPLPRQRRRVNEVSRVLE
jgi:nitroreductase